MPPGKKKLLRNKEAREVETLEERIVKEAPARGTNPLASGEWKAEDAAVSLVSSEFFIQLPISARTVAGLKSGKFVRMTDIQRAGIMHALAGRDILAAAKTGSGKTLAFLVPLLEKLYRLKWGPMDGVGALIITPTRELALQIFDVLRVVGSSHDFSAGLVIGGKSFEEEQTRICGMNILVCTPGRLLQHMDETPNFDMNNLKILVLDEADRILDLGFSRTVNGIIAGLPKARQTLLFSATQTKSVRSLARLSLTEPEYVFVHENADSATPKNLQQNYIVCDLQSKLDVMWGFIRTHLRQKTIVFVSSCKQAHFIYESFRHLRPGLPLMELHGKQKQMKRMAMYTKFCEVDSAVLFATDVAARGLDFPAVHWVFQLDCPEDVDSYIHRVGRTARYQADGKGLLVLTPSEIGFVDKLVERKISLSKISVNQQRVSESIAGQLAGLLSQDLELKYLGQKAFISYFRSIYLQANKDVFDVTKYPANEFATAMGLPTMPQIKFIQAAKINKNLSLKERHILAKEGEDDAASQAKSKEELTLGKKNARQSKVERLIKRQPQAALDPRRAKLREEESESDVEDLLVVKRRDHELDDTQAEALEEPSAKKQRKNDRLPKWDVHDLLDQNKLDLDEDEFKQYVKGKKASFDPEDRAREHERVREKHKRKKAMLKSLRPLREQQNSGGAAKVTLGHQSSSNDDDGDGGGGGRGGEETSEDEAGHSESEEEQISDSDVPAWAAPARSSKRPRPSSSLPAKHAPAAKKQKSGPSTLEEQEALALSILNRQR